jgi:hypothetical protein
MMFVATAQEAATSADPLLRAIRRKAQEHSLAYDYAFNLTDVVGARPTGSPAFARAARWARDTLQNLGIKSARLEGVTSEVWSEPGWSYRRFGVRLIEPSFDTLLAIPAPYSPPTQGRVEGEPIFFLLPGRSGLSVDEIIARFRGRLKGKILLVHEGTVPIDEKPEAGRRTRTDDELRELRTAPPQPAPSKQAEGNDDSEERKENSEFQKLFSFLRDEGAVAYLAPTRGNGGTMLATGSLGNPGIDPPPPPGFNLPSESYNRIVRLIDRGLRVRLEVELESQFHDPSGHTNVIGELPGNEQPEEIVIAGAHLDSWHVGTGATDNAANCAVLLEAFRILKVLQVPLKRTLRIALWAGHERGVQGSLSYVRTMTRSTDERHYLSFTMDSGAGRIRGLQIQGRQEWLAMADGWLEPFRGSGQHWVSMKKSRGSDQYSFDRAGLDNMVFIQDAAWNSRTYHSNMDLLDYVEEQDLRDSAAVVAAVLYRAANQ